MSCRRSPLLVSVGLAGQAGDGSRGGAGQSCKLDGLPLLSQQPSLRVWIRECVPESRLRCLSSVGKLMAVNYSAPMEPQRWHGDGPVHHRRHYQLQWTLNPPPYAPTQGSPSVRRGRDQGWRSKWTLKLILGGRTHKLLLFPSQHPQAKFETNLCRIFVFLYGNSSLLLQ